MPHVHGTTDRTASVRETFARGTYVTLSVTARAREEIHVIDHRSDMPRVVALPFAREEHPTLRIVSRRPCAMTAASAD